MEAVKQTDVKMRGLNDIGDEGLERWASRNLLLYGEGLKSFKRNRENEAWFLVTRLTDRLHGTPIFHLNQLWLRHAEPR